MTPRRGASGRRHYKFENKPQIPRIALVCDWLTTPGGAEKVLFELHKMYPKAPIYTSQYRPEKITWFHDATVKTGWLQFFPAALRRILGPLRQIYFSHLDLTAYDLVISVTGAEAKSIKAKKHLCYCHVPTQYYWQMYDKYVENPGFGILNPLVRILFKLFVRPLRRADFRAAKRPTQFVTISNYAKSQIKKYYHRDAVVISPGVDIKKFSTEFSTVNKKSTQSVRISKGAVPEVPPMAVAKPYFIIFCRQVTWKRVDLAIEACLAAKKRLVVIGDGPEHENLVRLAKDSDLITFVPWLDSEGIAAWLKSASAYIFPSLEPFGMAAVEALAAGCPVIAYSEGGSRDFVIPGKNGLLFHSQSALALERTLQDFQPSAFDKKAVARSATQFSPEHFREGIKHLVSELLERP